MPPSTILTALLRKEGRYLFLFIVWDETCQASQVMPQPLLGALVHTYGQVALVERTGTMGPKHVTCPVLTSERNGYDTTKKCMFG